MIQSDGGVLPVSVNAASLALVDAGVAMSDLVVACSAGYLDGMPVMVSVSACLYVCRLIEYMVACTDVVTVYMVACVPYGGVLGMRLLFRQASEASCACMMYHASYHVSCTVHHVQCFIHSSGGHSVLCGTCRAYVLTCHLEWGENKTLVCM